MWNIWIIIISVYVSLNLVYPVLASYDLATTDTYTY